MGQMYLGTLPALVLLTLGLVRGGLWRPEIRAYTIMSALLLLYALGNHTPAYSVFYTVLPGVSLFRRPADASFLIGGLLAILGGYLVHKWLTVARLTAPRRLRLLELTVVAGALTAALAIAVVMGKMAIAWKPLLSAVVWVGVAGVLLMLSRHALSRHTIAAVVVCGALMSVDLATNNGPNESTALERTSLDYEILKPDARNETIRFLKARARRAPGTEWRDRIELVGLGFEWPNAAMVHGLDTTLGYNPLRIGLVARALGAGDYIAGPDQRRFSPLFPSYRSTLANLVGLRFIASSIPIEQVDEKLARGDLKFLARTRDAYIYENVDALPRVLFVPDWQHADFEEIISSGRWPDFDPTKTVLLDGTPEIAGTAVESAAIEGASSIVRLRHYENTIVEIEVEAGREGFVVLNDVWHPWWRAEVDGNPATIYRANVLFRAVRVRPGRHVVRFEFRPFSGAIAELGEKLLGEDR
jgi:hypothetical protein